MYHGSTIPALVQWQESASITRKILVHIIKTIDKMELVHQNNNVNPLILLDRYRSQLEMPFLKYVHTTENHWIACIGVPYGIAL